MHIQIKPQIFTGHTHWYNKQVGVVFVEKEENIDPLFELLMAQDDYWENKKHLIKVAPKEIDSLDDLDEYLEYVGKTDIYHIEYLKEKIPFIIYQQPVNF